MYSFSFPIAKSENLLYAIQKKQDTVTDYRIRRIAYPDIVISSASTRWEVFFSKKKDEIKLNLLKDIAEYNRYVDRLESIPGLIDFFVQHDLRLSRQEVQERWSRKTADYVFSKKEYDFETDLVIVNDFLLDRRASIDYEICLEGQVLQLPIGKSSMSYPHHVGAYVLMWNWVNNGHDFCPALWKMLGSPYCKGGLENTTDDAVTYEFDAYEQFRFNPVEPQMAAIFHKLEALHYIKTYTICPQVRNPYWALFGKSDGSIDVALVDPAFKKNSLVKEQIELLLWAKDRDLDKKKYFLTDSANHQFLSSVPGVYGGHKKLKIYGRLDCPSALRYIQQGDYVRNRVFFADQQTAIAAGYRPCARCMPKEYKDWKDKNME
ncbi:Metal binding domain of Ada [Acidaminococcus fermentans]|jgi:hypothetical protein|uniref:Ada metal-binding domain-containing protein n=1 Tax=Acidaminococcus TaxID=904 RepID=UPI0008E1875F|nr:Ada metal-binding domain-containing protein [Acidaminococcus fermentans]SFO76111.1 Metal binding domain of Ada [Acidaminococcus fermentans]